MRSYSRSPLPRHPCQVRSHSDTSSDPSFVSNPHIVPADPVAVLPPSLVPIHKPSSTPGTIPARLAASASSARITRASKRLYIQPLEYVPASDSIKLVPLADGRHRRSHAEGSSAVSITRSQLFHNSSTTLVRFSLAVCQDREPWKRVLVCVLPTR
ncbi:hypothetical protein DFP72DRAFT_54104 [Ephemerocybe angulata]|uniref:Uncharacterized protein n=1 Tax=Ephemerocybe angulata TaxID=980116 RepID=A0A8H6LXX3_9AGAR|nr:hypothetical protein DFP72DRAFT_54104 [Tulosesus angulatus]